MSGPQRLSVVIPALNAGDRLGAVLASVARGRAAFDLDIVLSDGGSADGTVALAVAAGARVVVGPAGRGGQLRRGAEAAVGDWLLFLHADTVPEVGWARTALDFMENGANRGRAGYGRLVLDDDAVPARRVERLANWRAGRLGLPYGDQGLLLSRALYDELGGFAALPLMEDVDFVRRLGRRRLVALPMAMTTAATRYRRHGYWRRPLRNLACLTLYFLGLPPRLIVKLYG